MAVDRLRLLALDLQQDESAPGKRRSAADSWFLWRYRLDNAAHLQAEVLDLAVQKFGRSGLRADLVVVDGDDLPYGLSSLSALTQRGGGISLRSSRGRVGIVYVVERTGHLDPGHNRELAIWVPDERAAIAGASDLVNAVASSIPELEQMLQPAFGALSYHHEDTGYEAWMAWAESLESQRHPGELFWYQYFSAEMASWLDLSIFEFVGCHVKVREPVGVAVHLGNMRSDWLEMLASANQQWPFRGGRGAAGQN